MHDELLRKSLMLQALVMWCLYVNYKNNVLLKPKVEHKNKDFIYFYKARSRVVGVTLKTTI